MALGIVPPTDIADDANHISHVGLTYDEHSVRYEWNLTDHSDYMDFLQISYELEDRSLWFWANLPFSWPYAEEEEDEDPFQVNDPPTCTQSSYTQGQHNAGPQLPTEDTHNNADVWSPQTLGSLTSSEAEDITNVRNSESPSVAEDSQDVCAYSPESGVVSDGLSPAATTSSADSSLGTPSSASVECNNEAFAVPPGPEDQVTASDFHPEVAYQGVNAVQAAYSGPHTGIHVAGEYRKSLTLGMGQRIFPLQFANAPPGVAGQPDYNLYESPPQAAFSRQNSGMPMVGGYQGALTPYQGQTTSPFTVTYPPPGTVAQSSSSLSVSPPLAAPNPDNQLSVRPTEPKSNKRKALTAPQNKRSPKKSKVKDEDEDEDEDEGSSTSPDFDRYYPLICRIDGCKLVAATPSMIKRHRVTHFPKGYVCPSCDATFSRWDALIRHWRRSAKDCTRGGPSIEERKNLKETYHNQDWEDIPDDHPRLTKFTGEELKELLRKARDAVNAAEAKR